MAKKINYKSPFVVHTWFERDRMSIWVEDANGENVAEWWDEEVVQMFEDGFFDSNAFIMGRLIRPHLLGESVLNYLVENKIISENYTFEID